MSNGRTILVVDDEKQIRRFLRTGLGVHGYEVIEAESGAEALSMASTKAPDLVVLDLQLGDMDGLDVLQRIREWSWLPVLILSVRNREVEKVKALELGAKCEGAPGVRMPPFPVSCRPIGPAPSCSRATR